MLPFPYLKCSIRSSISVLFCPKKENIFASSFISANKISVHSRCDIFVPELEALKATLIEPGPGKWYLISL